MNIESAFPPWNKLCLAMVYDLCVCMCVYMCAWAHSVAQSHLILCNPVDCGLPGASVHGILQARILEWVPFPPPGDLPNPGKQLVPPSISCICKQIV